jgi:hypothetical protein
MLLKCVIAIQQVAGPQLAGLPLQQKCGIAMTKKVEFSVLSPANCGTGQIQNIQSFQHSLSQFTEREFFSDFLIVGCQQSFFYVFVSLFSRVSVLFFFFLWFFYFLKLSTYIFYIFQKLVC